MYKSFCLAFCAALVVTTFVEGKRVHSVEKLEAKLAPRYYEYPGYSYVPYNRYGDYYSRYRYRPKPKRPTKHRPIANERPNQPAPAPIAKIPKENEKPAEIIYLTKSKDPEQEDHEDEERDEKEA